MSQRIRYRGVYFR